MKAIPLGLIAGVTTALLSFSAATQTALSVPLMLASTLPIFIASLGWGTLSGAIAAVVGAVCISAFGDYRVALLMFCALYAPAAWVGHSCSLARDMDGDGEIDWFPLSEILFRLALSVAAGFIVVGVAIQYNAELVSPLIRTALQQIAGQEPELQRIFTPQGIDQILPSMVLTLPAMMAGFWTLVLANNLALGGSLARSSGLIDRPRDDIPRDLTLPATAAIMLAVSGAVFMTTGATGDTLAYIASALFGAMVVAFFMVGLATIHYFTRGLSGRILMLTVVYLMIVILAFGIPILAIAVLGLCETLFHLKDRRAKAIGEQ